MKDKLLHAIACPQCHAPLEYDNQHQRLICRQEQLCYPMNEGIPVLLSGEAIALAVVTHEQVGSV